MHTEQQRLAPPHVLANARRMIDAGMANMVSPWLRDLPDYRKFLFEPLLTTQAPASQRYQGRPNRLWLVSSTALLIAGILVVAL